MEYRFLGLVCLFVLFLRLKKCVCVCVCVCVYACTCVHMCIYMLLYIVSSEQDVELELQAGSSELPD